LVVVVGIRVQIIREFKTVLALHLQPLGLEGEGPERNLKSKFIFGGSAAQQNCDFQSNPGTNKLDCGFLATSYENCLGRIPGYDSIESPRYFRCVASMRA